MVVTEPVINQIRFREEYIQGIIHQVGITTQQVHNEVSAGRHPSAQVLTPLHQKAVIVPRQELLRVVTVAAVEALHQAVVAVEVPHQAAVEAIPAVEEDDK